MLNFTYYNPTTVYFGEGQIRALLKEIKKYGNKVLLVYGGGSIKKNGIYDEVAKIFKVNNIKFWELSGVQPNPRIQSVRDGVKICKENNIEVILAVGAGSVLDCSKVIAAGYYYEGDAWDLVIRKARVTNTLPLGTIITLAATGSEVDAGAVITNPDTNDKLALAHPAMTPKFSILDPTFTFTVPRNQTAAGTADIMSHIMETYFSSPRQASIQNRISEALLKTCIKYAPIALEEPENYEARANLMWASSNAMNGNIGAGKERKWVVHPMEHELSAYYDITHGVGLAILTPYWMEYSLNDETIDYFVEYGVNVWDLESSENKYEIAKKSIELTKDFFVSMGIPTKLSEVGIEKEKFQAMAKGAVRYGNIGSIKPLTEQDVLNIFNMAF
ncbi:alcohol dehydrogenase YqhD (iron-dependent ADH family) [Clostridium pascui]|uniref:iron-containing alcohol dehydrogenase n=1 Tax=Clostridium pascui TaxID=46609 RepID=UPI00195F22C4|nr:iron-containing alcohol dehydrogenase [Clostridium pascui]MBM7870670.1 alcohol dehydrogenase YqhD (iron-dependent ADH family) [Clostridium pascui]